MKIRKGGKVITVGDIHGEFGGLLEILRHAGMVDSRGDWAGGASILIQTGDMIDRGPCSVKAFHLLKKLQAEAREKGGEVIRLLGNHELALIQGMFGFADYPEPEKLARLIKEDVSKGNMQAAAFMHGRVFIHAAIRLAVIESLSHDVDGYPGSFEERLVDAMNSALKRATNTGDFTHPLFGNNGIFWARYDAELRDKSSHQIRQVFGHTIGNSIRASNSRDRICVDIGLCSSGKRGYLKFSDGCIMSVMKSSGRWADGIIAEY